jgi:hypothetical protein
MKKMDRQKIKDQLVTYRKVEQQLIANLQATRGAIQALEELLDPKEKKKES